MATAAKSTTKPAPVPEPVAEPRTLVQETIVTVDGRGVILPAGTAEADLPEGVRVRIELLPKKREPLDLADEPLWRIPELALETGIDDLATHIDHYPYGHPKNEGAGS